MNNNELAAKCLIEAAELLTNNETLTEGIFGFGKKAGNTKLASALSVGNKILHRHAGSGETSAVTITSIDKNKNNASEIFVKVKDAKNNSFDLRFMASQKVQMA